MNKVTGGRHFDCLPPADQHVLETASGRLHEIRALLVAIDVAGLLAELPVNAAARLHHQTGVSLLAVMDRELQSLIDEVALALSALT